MGYMLFIPGWGVTRYNIIGEEIKHYRDGLARFFLMGAVRVSYIIIRLTLTARTV